MFNIVCIILLLPLYAQVDYETEIQPIFDSRCTTCHGYAGGLNLSSYENVMAGSSFGPVIIPNDHAASELWKRVNSGQMPPGNNDLSQTQVNLIAQWIDEGALQEPEANEPGDLNGDGIINILDVVGLINIILGQAPENPAGDLNQDGIYNVLDVVLMVNLILSF